MASARYSTFKIAKNYFLLLLRFLFFFWNICWKQRIITILWWGFGDDLLFQQDIFLQNFYIHVQQQSFSGLLLWRILCAGITALIISAHHFIHGLKQQVASTHLILSSNYSFFCIRQQACFQLCKMVCIAHHWNNHWLLSTRFLWLSVHLCLRHCSRVSAITTGITSAAEASAELISLVSCLKGASSVIIFSRIPYWFAVKKDAGTSNSAAYAPSALLCSTKLSIM